MGIIGRSRRRPLAEVALETSLLQQGIELMFVGMGTVFFFLGILVAGMLAMSTIAVRFVADAAVATGPDGANEEEIAAITAAIEQHRKSRTK